MLAPYRPEQPIVVGLPRGGVPVAAEVARALAAPLDVAVVRKIGAPQNTEYAIGAVAEGGVHVLGHRQGRSADLTASELGALIEHAERELDERLRRYRGTRIPIELEGRTVIVVDDGLATGRSALAAVRSLRRRGAARVILAAPVASREAARLLGDAADEVLCLEIPPDLWAVGAWYVDFRPTTDEEVARLLAENASASVTCRRPSSR
jgi:predicted phosphoribosyltransferase